MVERITDLKKDSNKIGEFESPEELAKALEEKNKSLADRIRNISQRSIESDSKDLRKRLQIELTPTEQREIREALPNSGVDNIFREGMTDEERQSLMTKRTLAGVVGTGAMAGIEDALSMGEKIMNWWDKLTTGFGSLMWERFPKMAEMLGIEDPRAKMKAEAEEKAKKAKEKAGEMKDKALDIAKPKADTFAKIYFKMFRASSELDKINGLEVDKKTEEEVARCVIDSNYFKSLRYHDLNNPKNADTIYNQIKDNLREIPEIDKNNPNKIKRYIKLVLMSISGGQETVKKGWFSKDENVAIQRGNNFLKAHYKKIDEENPTMDELFGKLEILGDFDIFHKGNGDMEDVLQRMKGKVENLYEGGAKQIANLSEIDFESMKSGLDSKLQNLGEFKVISISILESNPSRHLGNNFTLTEASDPISKLDSKSQELVNGFIGNSEKGLIKYGHDMFGSFFTSGILLSSTRGIDKNTITLKEVYSIYLITGGKTKVEDLSPMQKLNLTRKLMFGFGSAQDVGEKVADTISKISSGETKISPEVENIILSIGKASINMMKDGAETLGKFGYGFAKEKPILAAGLLVVALKFPFFTKKHSLM